MFAVMLSSSPAIGLSPQIGQHRSPPNMRKIKDILRRFQNLCRHAADSSANIDIATICKIAIIERAYQDAASAWRRLYPWPVPTPVEAVFNSFPISHKLFPVLTMDGHPIYLVV